jgi:hypothetical protein
MNPLVMMQLMGQMQQGGQQGVGLPPVMPQGQQQPTSPSQPSFEQIMSGHGEGDPMAHLMTMQPSSSSILDEGALSAIKSAKTALQMDEGEKNRALGMGLVKLFAGMAKPGYGDGLNGALSAAAQNMPGAVDAYTQEEGRVQNMNAALLNHISQMQAKQQEAWMNAIDKARERDYKKETLQAKKDHYANIEKKQDNLYDLKKFGLGLKMDKSRQEEDKQRHIDEALARGETPLEVLEPSARAEYQKNALKSIREIPVNKRALQTIGKMRKIFKDHPDIGSDWVQWLAGSNDPKKEAGFWQVLGRKFADKKKLAALQQLKKHASDLNLATILGTPGKVGTDLLKRTIAESSPGGNLTQEGFENIAGDWETRAQKNIHLAQKYQQGLKRKMLVSDEDEDIPAGSSQTTGEDLSTLSTEELMKEYQTLGGQ